MKTVTNLLIVTIFFSFLNQVNAQSLTDVLKNSTAIKLIDNKGTIKYLQSNNGITQIVNTVNDKTTTTWQLGGKLVDNTYIDVNSHILGLDKLTLETGNSSTDAVSLSSHGVGSGWTFLVRDEFTGEIKKKIATDFISSGHSLYNSILADVTANKVELVPAGLTSDINKIWVYRNGSKLISGIDYTLSSGKIIVQSPASGNTWSISLDDVFEIHWLK